MKGVLEMHARVEDRIEIESLMKRYCLFFDTKRADDLALLFTDDAVIDYGPEVEPVRGQYYGSEVIGHLYGGYRYRFLKQSDGWKISDLKLFASGMDGFHRTRMHDFRLILEDQD